MSWMRISESEDWFVDYDRERGMYRVSYFEDNHFVDECFFDAYEEKEIPEEVIDKFNSIGCTSFQLTAEELEKIGVK